MVSVPPISNYQLADFWDKSPQQREDELQDAIKVTHRWHFHRNQSYRRIVEGHGIGEELETGSFHRLLRPTAQTFKSYIELLGTPFPQDKPRQFLYWLDDQLSVELPKERFDLFRGRYKSLEALLQDIERIFADFEFEISTSSGTSGRSTIMVRDQDSISKTVESFYLAFQRYLGMRADHRAIFIMPEQTRIAMARMVGFCVSRVGLPSDRVHYAIPFPAYPDHVRIRTGRTYQSGLRGVIERRVFHRFMNWANDHIATPQAVRSVVNLLERAQAAGEKVLLFGSWIHLHAVALELRSQGKSLRLAPGSLLGTGGGFKELYPFNMAQIRADLALAIELADGQPIPLRDVYGMAEGNWAAMQCHQGNYHVPPWIYVTTLDQDDQPQRGIERTGMLAFFDPFGGGKLFPSFFKTADRVKLVNGTGNYNPAYDCPCGEAGAYFVRDTIQRVDMLDEAGCAAQI